MRRRAILLVAIGSIIIGCKKTQRDAEGSSAQAQSADASERPTGATAAKGLFAARAGFETKVRASTLVEDAEPAPTPPSDELVLIRYPSAVGGLAAYLTPDPGDGKKHPAILWATGGFGGIGSYLWEEASPDNDQSVRAFLDEKIVVMCPSYRGENDNPGRFEMFYGEVDDLLAARHYLAALPYVDPERIYLFGHSTGGTLALLAATAGAEFRAIVSFGGWPDVGSATAGYDEDEIPFDRSDEKEVKLRTPAEHVAGIVSPTYYLEGEASANAAALADMHARATQAGVPYWYLLLPNADHFNILAPINRLLAARVASDTGAEFQLSPGELDRAVALAGLLYHWKPYPLFGDFTIDLPDTTEELVDDSGAVPMHGYSSRMGSMHVLAVRMLDVDHPMDAARGSIEGMTRALSFEASSDVRATTIAGLEAVDVALQAPEREGKLIAFVDDDNAAVVLGLWPDTVDPPIIWDDLVESIQHSSVTTRPSAKR